MTSYPTTILPQEKGNSLFPEPPSHYELCKNLGDYIVYEMGQDPRGRYSVAIIDVLQVAPHFHKREEEHFMVLSGQARVTLDGETRLLSPGDQVRIVPSVVHSFTTADPKRAVRFLVTNFPAFDPTDFYPVEKEVVISLSEETV